MKALEEISKYLGSSLEENRAFIVRKERGVLVWSAPKEISLQEKVKSGKCLIEHMIEIVKHLDLKSLSAKEFALIQTVVDTLYYCIQRLIHEKGVFEKDKQILEASMLSLKLGGKVPLAWLLDPKQKLFAFWIRKNYLHHRFFALRIQIPFQSDFGAYIPIENKGNLIWIPYSQVEIHGCDNKQFFYKDRLLFETDYLYELKEEYACLWRGVMKLPEVFTFLPYDYQNPEEWGNKYLLEVWTVAMRQPKDKPSMLRKTHAYFCLRSADGAVRSCGQDVLAMVKDAKVREVFSRKAGANKITVPDNYVFYPKTARQFWKATIEITKEEHDRIIAIVEKDKQGQEHIASLLRGNCVSYVAKILKLGIGLEIDPKMHAMHVFGKHFLPNRWYRGIFKRFDPWYKNLPTWMQQTLFFFPLFYLPIICLGIIASFMKTNNIDGKTDFRLVEVFVSPWILACAHPLQLQREIERESNHHRFKIWIQKKA